MEVCAPRVMPRTGGRRDLRAHQPNSGGQERDSAAAQTKSHICSLPDR